MTFKQSVVDFFCTIWRVVLLYPWWENVGLFMMPIITSLLNIHVNHVLMNTATDFYYCILMKSFYDYTCWIVQHKFVYRSANKMRLVLEKRIKLAKVMCAVPISGEVEKKYDDLIRELNKLRDFLFVIPNCWTSIITFCITIVRMKNDSEYPLRVIFAVFCIGMLTALSYLTDVSLYITDKPSKKITNLTDSRKVRLKIAMGSTIDADHELTKRDKMDAQHDVQKYCIICINCIITIISLLSKDLTQIHIFGSISWMMGSLSDNIKSFQYSDYVGQFLDTMQLFEKHQFVTEEPQMALGKIDSVSFVNASFGYFTDMVAGTTVQKITNLTYTFKGGLLYYLEAPNGEGKTTWLRMFLSNLLSGDVFFGGINRKNLSYENILRSVFHLVQASEYTPKFTKDEFADFLGRDKWLEEQLAIKDLLQKDTVEISGGQKKRILLYLALTSDCSITLLDEVLSELSVEETKEVPEGGGWLTRIVNTISAWENPKKKIIILVGHGIVDMIPNQDNIVKLRISNEENKPTTLMLR